MVHTTYEEFVDGHRNQLESSNVPRHFWTSLYMKVAKQTLDAGNIFTLLRIQYDDTERYEVDPAWQLQITQEGGIKHNDPQHIYLVDHAWTFNVEYARNQLLQVESLRERMARLMGLDHELEKVELSEKIFNNMWKYCNSYSIGNAENIEDRMPVWYIMDEVGSAIGHSDTPNFRMVPFIHINDQQFYSLIFPIKDLEYGETVCRDFVEGVIGNLKRSAYLLPWKNCSFLDVSFEHVQPGADYFLSEHIEETLPVYDNLKVPITKKNKYKVYSQYNIICEFLTSDKFEIIDNEEEADILWYTQHFKNFGDLSKKPDMFINQFPFEYVLTIKDLLCITCRRKNSKNTSGNLQTLPEWLPTTYNLKNEVTQFVSYYQHLEQKDLDNHWIIKPFNLARSLDTHITNNLKYIMRLAATGSKIAQKYIHNPVLFYRPEINGKVKFDIRYVILLKSSKPLQVYVYRNFFLRFANKPFELNNFDEYEKHFTVMNYTKEATLKHMLCLEFLNHWNEQFPNISWDTIENSIFEMLREIFECAIIEDPPCGIPESPQSRALYAADIMLEWKTNGKIQPKILEINWTPDCKRACDYYKDFFNDIFKLLFLDENIHEVFATL